jgi:mRNA-degrading endonuclease toxin of MazEF toxin-antitoxin module
MTDNSFEESKTGEIATSDIKNSYNSLDSLELTQKTDLLDKLNIVIGNIKKISYSKAIRLITQIPLICKLHYNSLENKKMRQLHPDRHHPIQPIRGEIYNAEITEGIGCELCGNHLVVVMSNPHTNIFSEKVNVLPIEGDGNSIPKYLEQLTNNDLVSGHLDKDPSRVIIPEILTIDKARLQRKIGEVNPQKISKISQKLKKQLQI